MNTSQTTSFNQNHSQMANHQPNGSGSMMAQIFSSGYVPVSNYIFDKVMAELSGNEYKVYMYIYRRTVGFQKESDFIALSQFVNGIVTRDGKVLDNGTGLSKATIVRCLDSLEQKGHIRRYRGQSETNDHKVSIYQLNLFVDASDNLPKVFQTETDTHSSLPKVSQVKTDIHDSLPKVSQVKTDIHDSLPKASQIETDINDISLQVTQIETDANANLSEVSQSETDTISILNKSVSQVETHNTIEQQNTVSQQKSNNTREVDSETPKTPHASNDVVVALLKFNVSEAVARKLAENYDAPYIHQKIAYLEFSLARDKESIPNPAGWLRRAIEQDYAAPNGFSVDPKRQAKQKAKEAKRAAEIEAARRLERQMELDEIEKKRRQKEEKEQRIAMMKEQYHVTDESLALWQEVRKAVRTEISIIPFVMNMGKMWLLGIEQGIVKLGFECPKALAWFNHEGYTAVENAFSTLVGNGLEIETAMV